MLFVALSTASLFALATAVPGASPGRRHPPHMDTVTLPPTHAWPEANVLELHGIGNGVHHIVEPRCVQAFKELTHLAGAELFIGMQDGLIGWWSRQIEEPIPLFPACLKNITDRMNPRWARQILAGKYDSKFDDLISTHEAIQMSALRMCKETFEATEASVFHGTGGALHLLVKTAAWLRLRPDRQEELKEACIDGGNIMLDRRRVRPSPCQTASRTLGKEIYSGVTVKPWQHGVRKWWLKNHDRLLGLMHSDYHHNDTSIEAHGLLMGEYDDMIGMDDPVVLLDKPHCNSVCKEIVRMAGDSGIHGQWGSFHFMLKAREWIVLHHPAVDAWEDTCLHRGEHEGRPVKRINILDNVRAGVDLPQAIRGRASRISVREFKSRNLITRRGFIFDGIWHLTYALPLYLILGMVTGLGVYHELRLLMPNSSRWAHVAVAALCGLLFPLLLVSLALLSIWELGVLLTRSPRRSVFRWYAEKRRSAKTGQLAEPARHDERGYSM